MNAVQLDADILRKYQSLKPMRRWNITAKKQMKKYFHVALLALVSATMFVACGPKNKSTDDEEPTEGKTYAGDTWITSPDQFDPSLVNDSVKSCWEWHVWCDGTTIGVVPFWGTEAQLLWMIDQSMKAELKVFGEYHKKYRYYLVEENTETACLARQWEGAECWLETITYPDKNGVKQTSEEYCWLPEKNIKERHDYYLAHLEQLGVVSHTYERVTDKKDRDACIALNPEDNNNGGQPGEPKDYSKYDDTTEKCWKVTQEAYGLEIITYVWMTERKMVEQFDQVGLKYVYEPADAADEDACNDLQEKVPEAPEACWKITTSIMGQNVTEYYWGTEAEAAAQVNAIKSVGGTGSYTKTAIDDPEACQDPNQD